MNSDLSALIGIVLAPVSLVASAVGIGAIALLSIANALLSLVDSERG